MSDTSLALIEPGQLQTAPVVITEHQLDVIKNTICKDATPAEMELFFYDCRRRGVHPMDKLIHFTKRAGKYTPVTSIDFFRSRAAETGEHMGTDDAYFTYAAAPTDVPAAASVTVYRLVQGEKCPFTATARMSEYLPGPPNDFMWKKMPHGQLGKCAEALALRKAFPQQLADLHTVDEMSQADEAPSQTSAPQPGQRKSQQQNGNGASAGHGSSPATTSTTSTPSTSSTAAATQSGASTAGTKSPIGKIKSVEDKQTQTGKTYYAVTLFTGFGCTTWSETLATEARKHKDGDRVVELVTELKDPKYPPTLRSIKVVNTDTGEVT